MQVTYLITALNLKLKIEEQFRNKSEDDIDGNVKASNFHGILTVPELDCLNAQSPERSDLCPLGATYPA